MNDQDVKFDRVASLCVTFQQLANALGMKYKTSGPVVSGFQLRKYRSEWDIVYLDEQKSVADCSIQIKRVFLAWSDEFFDQYLAYAKEWEKNIDKDIAVGERTLRKLQFIGRSLRSEKDELIAHLYSCGCCSCGCVCKEHATLDRPVATCNLPHED
jgi:hypothetical protein